ncbi:beta-1,3-galactosyltransferase 5-like [Pectinophora gossypiella]|uniref:beta-1,3-galactosyltransferase 5-like n=1 Tax=Pectinophora gossypiella TaxID=13191 RepID=UPI00214E7EF8|nr:beta-1,3-galactosyltransferase 5-like [Pectinophora gossypiella]
MKTMMIRRTLWKTFGLRKPSLLLPLLIWTVLVTVCWRLSRVSSGLLLPPAPHQDLSHFRRSRSLQHYLDEIQLLIEPSSVLCSLQEEPVVVLVASAPSRLDHREAIRRTWGSRLPTYFIMGLDGDINDEQLVDNYVEAKQYSDLVVFDFREHYQNLTLKTGLMLQWTLNRCPQARFLYKTDDDMLVNPWVLKDVLRDRGDAKMLGYVYNNSLLHRDEHNKWYLPRWLCSEDVIPQYMTGPGYLISGEYLRAILQAANKVPLHNLEDVYFTYNVAKKTLHLTLSHDSRLSPFRPWSSWLPFGCHNWRYASIHSVTPQEILRIWTSIQPIGDQYSKGHPVCQNYDDFLRFFGIS